MGIVSFVFDKMSAEKTGKITSHVNISHNFNIRNVEKIDLNIQGKKPALKLSFDFVVNYEPNIGTILMKGNLTYLDKEEEINKLEAGLNSMQLEAPKEEKKRYLLGTPDVIKKH